MRGKYSLGLQVIAGTRGRKGREEREGSTIQITRKGREREKGRETEREREREGRKICSH